MIRFIIAILNIPGALVHLAKGFWDEWFHNRPPAQ